MNRKTDSYLAGRCRLIRFYFLNRLDSKLVRLMELYDRFRIITLNFVI